MSIPSHEGPPNPALVARALLQHVEGWYAAHVEGGSDAEVGNLADPLPEARYVAGGAPREIAWDHEGGQCTVAIERVLTGLSGVAPVQAGRSPGSSASNVARLNRSVVLELQLVRCAPALDSRLRSPGRDVLDAHGALLASDAGHLYRAITDAVTTGALVREHVRGAEVLVGDLVTLGPDGGLAGLAQLVTVPLL